MMYTRRMNERITVFSFSGGQNEDGEVVEQQRKDLFTCWAEVAKTTVKDFKQNTVNELQFTKDSKVFIVRYSPHIELDNSMYVDFHGLEYAIVAVEIDYASKDMILIKAERVT